MPIKTELREERQWQSKKNVLENDPMYSQCLEFWNVTLGRFQSRWDVLGARSRFLCSWSDHLTHIHSTGCLAQQLGISEMVEDPERANIFLGPWGLECWAKVTCFGPVDFPVVVLAFDPSSRKLCMSKNIMSHDNPAIHYIIYITIYYIVKINYIPNYV